MGYTQPVASIRLKAQRRGLQDFEYFWLLAQKSGREKADALVDRIVYKRPFGKQAMLDTEIWKNDPAEWDRARNAAGESLSSR